MFTRRTFLRLSGMAAGSVVFPGCIEKALDIQAASETKSIMDIEHVVILIQENRAFDHYLGTLPGIRGFGDRFPIPVEGAQDVFHQQTDEGILLPYHLDSAQGNAQRVDGTPHGFDDGHDAYDHGRMNRWPVHKSTRSMGYYKRAEMDFQFALSEAFTVCDGYHCSLVNSTNPNRLMAFTGTIDPLGKNGGPALDNSHDMLGKPDDGYTWKTYAERLEEAGVSWAVYQDIIDNFTDNPLYGFRTFRDAGLNDQESPLFLKGIASRLEKQTLDGLRNDVEAGTLPSVSWIVGPGKYTEHPSVSSPVEGGVYVQQVIEALTANPEVFRKTVLFITYDENDGFFDHVPPPAAPSRRPDGTLAGASTVDDTGERHADGTTEDYAGHPYGPGMRVPMWIVSPWTRGGYVCSQTFDHTSILRFLEARFGVIEENISPFRRAMCGDLTSAFDFETPNEELPELPTRERSEATEIRRAQEKLPDIEAPVGVSSPLPEQEEGTRPSRALPYELEVTAEVGTSDVKLAFLNTGEAGAVFHVYDRNALSEIPRRYAVEGGKSLEDTWSPSDDGSYSLFVLGPSGFHRDFSGKVGALTNLGVEAVYDPPAQRMAIRCHNRGSAPIRARITPMAYLDGSEELTLAAGEVTETWLDISESGRWYDLAVRLEEDASFVRRLAGRMENGKPSITDPAMGARSGALMS